MSGDHAEHFKQITAATLRTMARKAEMDISFSAAEAPIGLVRDAKKPRLPVPDQSMSDDALRLVRGCADANALRLSKHDETAHAHNAPQDITARAAFDAMEQARIEALGAQYMDGVGHNLSRVLEEKFKRRGFISAEERDDIPLPDALHALVRQAVTGEDMTPALQKAQDLWGPWIEGHLKDHGFESLKPLIADQNAYAEMAKTLIAEMQMQISDNKAGSDTDAPEDGDGQQDQQDDPDDSQNNSSDEQPDAAGVQGMDDGSGDSGEQEQAFESGYDEIMQEMESDGAGEINPDQIPERPSGYQPGEHGYYKIYTSQYDEEIEAEELADTVELYRLRRMLDQQLTHHQQIITKLANRLGRRLMARQQRSWQFDLEEGILDSARLARVIANPNVPLSFKQEQETDFRDTIVSLLIDNSGSMRGRPIALAAMSADIIARTLERCGVKVEILGFTTRAWKGGKSRDLWMQNGRPENPGRLNDLRHIIYKSADSPMRRTRKNLGLMLKEGVLKENIDGEALAWAYNRLVRRAEARKIMMVISDGAPVDDSTLSVNPSNILEHDLRNIIHWVENKSAIELTAIGIGHDVTRYYNKAITIADAEDLGRALVGQLDSLFAES